jgi:predicted ABC-type exoprotein transport system permease subunit
MRSVNAVGLGVFLALLIGLLAVFGILAPVLTRVLGLELVGSTALPTSLLVFAAAFSFYFGGMAASYRAPARRRLHGTLVAVVAFAISPTINLVTGEGLFPGLDTGRAVLLATAFLAVSVAASYVGARRGEALYAHNQRLIRRGRLSRVA